jgi:hypothetical protein
MVEKKVYRVQDIWSKVDLYIKVTDSSGGAMPRVGYTVLFRNGKREGTTGEDGMISEPALPGGDIRLQLEDGRVFFIDWDDGPHEGGEASSTGGAAEEEESIDYREFDELVDDGSIEGPDGEAESVAEYDDIDVDDLPEEFGEEEGNFDE